MYVRQKPAEEIGRVPHVRLSVHPDFLSRSLALTYFMRLSLMKSRIRIRWWRLVQEIRDRGPKTTGAAQRSLCHRQKAHSPLVIPTEAKRSGGDLRSLHPLSKSTRNNKRGVRETPLLCLPPGGAK
jgi:hypothetical protein